MKKNLNFIKVNRMDQFTIQTQENFSPYGSQKQIYSYDMIF